jgi:hypothetical protein
MIPAFEFDGYISILAIFLTLSYRLYKCNKTYDYNMIKNLIFLGILCSIIWIFFGYKYKLNDLIKQFIFTILLYLIFLIYFYCKK